MTAMRRIIDTFEYTPICERGSPDKRGSPELRLQRISLACRSCILCEDEGSDTERASCLHSDSQQFATRSTGGGLVRAVGSLGCQRSMVHHGWRGPPDGVRAGACSRSMDTF